MLYTVAKLVPTNQFLLYSLFIDAFGYQYSIKITPQLNSYFVHDVNNNMNKNITTL